MNEHLRRGIQFDSHYCFKTVVNLFLEDIRMIIQKWLSNPPNSDPLVKLLCFQASELVQQVKAFAMQGLWHEFNPENPQKAKYRGGHLEPQHSCGHTEGRDRRITQKLTCQIAGVHRVAETMGTTLPQYNSIPKWKYILDSGIDLIFERLSSYREKWGALWVWD